MGIDFKIALLRKQRGVSQQQLAEHLGVTFQSVSKWETKSSLPDITLLPEIAKYFDVSVDELLGLKPLKGVEYVPRDTDNREKWRNRLEVIENNREFFWNDDYLAYLVREVWKIQNPVHLLELCCSNADLGKRLMKALPSGSTYTGVDSEFLIEEARKNLKGVEFPYQLISSDVYEFKTRKKYDVCVCQAALRHMNHPKKILQNMKEAVKEDGLVVSIEINREIENVGLYVDGMNYDYLCTAFDWSKLWRTELEKEGRDYAIGVRVPFYMKEIGLKDVDVRMNDKVTFLTPEHPEYTNLINRLRAFRGWKAEEKHRMDDAIADFYLSRGYKRDEIENLDEFQKEMSRYFEENKEKVSLLHYFGLLITYGRK